MCSFIVFMPSVRMCNVNGHENKENPLNEKVCPNKEASLWKMKFSTCIQM